MPDGDERELRVTKNYVDKSLKKSTLKQLKAAS
jgi:hypothetical protein